ATAADLIARRARQAAPNETGGLLLGWWEGTAVVVAHAVEVPDPDATSSRWTRHEDTAQAALDAALPDPSHPWLGYVGDWHSHPAPVDCSTTDELAPPPPRRRPPPPPPRAPQPDDQPPPAVRPPPVPPATRPARPPARRPPQPARR